MPDPVDPQMPTPAQRRRPFVIAVVRGLSVTIVLTVAYFSCRSRLSRRFRSS